MITLEPFKAEHAYRISKMMSNDFVEAMRFHESRCTSFTAFYNEDVMCCGGVNVLWEGVGEAWTVNGPLTLKYPVTFHKIIVRWLKLLTDKHRLLRLQSIVDAQNETHIRWIESLGFEREGTLRKYHGGKDYHLYARIGG